MNIQMRVLLTAFIAAGTLSSCSSTEAGSPVVPTPTQGSPTAAPSSANLAEIKACELLEQLVANQGFSKGENVSRRNQCTVSKPGYGSKGLALDDSQGLAEFQRTDPASVEINLNGRRALQTKSSGGACDVAIEVSEKARALAGVTLSDPDADGCPEALKFAEQVEPLLPKAQ